MVHNGGSPSFEGVLFVLPGRKKGVRQRAISKSGWNCDSLTVVAVPHFDSHLTGHHLAAIGRADDYFSRFQLLFVINILQNRVQFDPRTLKKLICSQFT